MDINEFHFKKKLSFVLEKLEQIDDKLKLVANVLENKGYEGITKFEIDLLNEANTILVNLEFHNEMDEELQRKSINDFIKSAQSLIDEFKEVIYKEDDNTSYVSESYEKYKYMYKTAHEDFTMGLGKTPN